MSYEDEAMRNVAILIVSMAYADDASRESCGAVGEAIMYVLVHDDGALYCDRCAPTACDSAYRCYFTSCEHAPIPEDAATHGPGLRWVPIAIVPRLT